VRIGLLGPLPAESPPGVLERACDFLLTTQAATRIVYLGADDALEQLVVDWATRLVGGDPTDEAAWARAAQVAIAGSADQIDGFVTKERKRLSLRALVSLPEDTLSALETMGDTTVLLIHRRGDIEPDDVASAQVLIYGNGAQPLVERLGSRWFVTPGSMAGAGGVGVLDDENGFVFRSYDAGGNLLRATPLPRGVTMPP
jgi:hypothetical protein